MPDRPNKPPNMKELVHEVIFEADTPAGKWFDVLLIVSILASVAVVMADSVGAIRINHGRSLLVAEWFFTLLFTIEYALRLISVRSPMKYALSFYGVIDFLAIVPTYLSLVFPATKYFLVLRLLRILRVFRVLKLLQYLKEADLLVKALTASRRKITVFLFVVLTLVTIFGSLMYVIEGEANGFTSIPRGIYWAIVTMTTVGYGDVAPRTGFGQLLASFIMILGYAIIAVPTGIVTAEIGFAMTGSSMTGSSMTKGTSRQACLNCSLEGHDTDAVFCKFCGEHLGD
jgi:voltage-gated potassium channel